jgi:hypothetical protein
LYRLWISSNPAYCGVDPHLDATFTINIVVPSNCLRSSGLPSSAEIVVSAIAMSLETPDLDALFPARQVTGDDGRLPSERVRGCPLSYHAPMGAREDYEVPLGGGPQL